jgi:hypothetical protein
MSNIRRTEVEILEKFTQQIELLNLANLNFDDGKEISALNIATTLRVLVHDTIDSTSALKHINKKNIEFFETSQNDINSESVYLGIVTKYFSGVKFYIYLYFLMNFILKIKLGLISILGGIKLFLEIQIIQI